MKYSFIITTYKRSKYLEILLNDISNLNYNKNSFELVVFNDWNDIDTNKSLKKFSKLNLVVLKSDKRIYGSIARNKCIQSAKGENLIFADDDIRIDRDLLHKLDEYIKDYDAFCFTVKNRLAFERNRIFKIINKYFFGKVFLPLGIIIGDFDECDGIAQVDHFPGCFFCVKRKFTQNVFFDEYIGQGNGYFDDLSFCLQLKRKLKLYCIGKEKITHLQAEQGGYREKNINKFYYYYFNHKSYLIRKYGRNFYTYTALLPNILEALVLSILKRKILFSIFIKAWFDGAKKIHKF